MHGNSNCKPWNAAKFEDKESAVKFKTNYAEVNALPLPGRVPRFNDYDIMLLPFDTTKASVHRKYVTCTEELQKTSGKFVHCFGYREFCRLWSSSSIYMHNATSLRYMSYLSRKCNSDHAVC